jgi:heat shock protein 4
LGTASDSKLGGRDFDRLLVQHFVQEIQEKYKIDPSNDPKAMMRLTDAADRAKKVLSANSETSWNVECLMNDIDVSGYITRDTFEEMAQPLLERILLPIEQAIHNSGVELKSIHSMEVIGGSIRIPAVRKRLEQYFGQPLSTTCDGDESVARGAALQCAMLSPNFRVRDFEVHDITPYAIEVGYGPVDAAIEDSTELFSVGNQIPSIKLISFYRSDQFQIRASYSHPESIPIATNPFIGRFLVSDIPSSPDASKPLKSKVKIKMDLNGILSISSAQALEELASEEVAAPPAKEEAVTKDSPMEDESRKDGDDRESAPAPEPMDAREDAPPSKDEDKPMDTSPEKVVKKKKIKRTDLTVESQMVGGLTKTMIEASVEREAAMLLRDRVIAETSARRNDLETYIYEMRDQVEMELSEFIAEKPRMQFLDQLTGMEDWLYSDEGETSQKSEYVLKLDGLKAIGDPIVKRHYEWMHRDDHVATLKSTIGRYQTWAQTEDEASAHIPEEKKHEVLKKCSDLDVWLADLLTQQNRLNKADDPVLLVQDLEHHRHQLQTFCDPIRNMPKPKPAPEPRKEEPAAATPEDATKKEQPDVMTDENATAADGNQEPAVPAPEMDVD